VLQYVAACCSVMQRTTPLHCNFAGEGAVCCSVLQCIAVYCSVLQCVAVCCSVSLCVAVCRIVLQHIAVCCIVAVLHCRSMLQHYLAGEILCIEMHFYICIHNIYIYQMYIVYAYI